MFGKKKRKKVRIPVSEYEYYLIETQDDGSVVPVEYEVVKTYLYVDTIPLAAAEAAEKYGLDEKQRKQLDELLSDRNKELWEGLLS